MANEWLICSVTSEGGQLICTCLACGWVSPRVRTGAECGVLWDDHRTAHPSAVSVDA